MVSDSRLPIPTNPTFEQAIALTQSLLDLMERQDLSTADITAAIADLVKTEAGARGFFVTYLTDNRSLADQPTPAVIQALQTAPETVAELLVKNLAMSTAMALHHDRQQDPTMSASSRQVQARTANLISLVQLTAIQVRADQLLESLLTGAGPYTSFLDRWGYDEEQRQAIQAALTQAIQPFS